jgi:putative transcriptional regulator
MIKNNLKMILADREISINKLAELTGIRYATLHAFVKQRVSSINVEVLDKVCEVLGLMPADFIIYIPNNEQE